MNVQFENSFARDLKKIRNNELKARVADVIRQVERANSLQEVEDFK